MDKKKELKMKMRVPALILVLLSFSFYFTIPYLQEKSKTLVSQELSTLLRPEDEAVKDFITAKKTFKAIDLTLVILDSPEGVSLMKVMKSLEKDFKTEPLPYTQKIITNVNEILKFFETYSPLYLPPDLYDLILDQLEKDEHLRPGKMRKDTINLRDQNLIGDLRKNVRNFYYEKKFAKFSSFKNLSEGYFLSEQEDKALFIIVHPDPISRLDEINSFSNALEEKLNMVRERNNVTFTWKISGDASNYHREYKALWSSFNLSGISSLLLTIIVLYLLFRNFRSMAMIYHALLVGMISASLLITHLVTEINSMVLFLLIVVMGNAVNSNIVFMHYYLLSFDKPKGLERSLAALKKSLMPTAFAVTSSCIVYGSFMAGDFRGYNDMALVGIVGMLVSWLTGMGILFITTLSDLGNFTEEEVRKYLETPFPIWSSAFNFIERFHCQILATVFIIFTSSAIYLQSADLKEKDMTKIRNEDYTSYNQENIAEELRKVGLSKEYIPQLVLVTKDMESAFKLQNQINEDEKLRELIPGFQSYTMKDLLPSRQDATAAAIKKLTTSFKESDILESPYITKWQEKIVKDAFKFQSDIRVKQELIPEDFKLLFHDQNGNFGNVIYLSFNINRLEQNGDSLKLLVHHLKNMGGSDLFVAGTIPVMAAIDTISAGDRFPVLIYSLTLVFCCIIVFNLSSSSHIFAYLVAFLGITGLFLFFIAVTGTKLNILNFIAVPMTIILSIDYLSNYAHALDTGHDVRMRDKTFSMVATMSFTTIVSYLSIYFTTGQLALKSFAILALVGEISTLVGGIIFFLSARIFFMRSVNFLHSVFR